MHGPLNVKVALNIILQHAAVHIRLTVRINITYKYIILSIHHYLDWAQNCHEQASLRPRLCIWSGRIHKLPDENYLTAYEDKTEPYLLNKGIAKV